MSKALIIAEKPSVAADIARALGGFTKHDEYYESDDHVLSSAVGHLVEIAAPDEYEVKRGKWSFAHLPVIPPHFDLRPIAKSESRLKVLTRLIKRKDVTSLINACDAGREGELIFRLIAQHANTKLPIQRLWLQSMTPQAIRDGFAQLRSDNEMLPLADAARCRSEADWLVGINGTRAMTAFNSKGGGFFLTTVGRVQTPTLSIVVEREEKIKRFVPRDYWEVRAEFIAAAGLYEGRWFDPKFKKSEFDPEQRESRLWSEAEALSIVAACRDKPGTVTEESKPSTQMSPALFDLTSLQREANSRFGFSAKNTLGLAQALYEKHKVLTYPRTDSRALPEDYLGTVRQTLDMLADSSHNYLPHAKKILASQWVKPNKRIFDNSKISDHFAIIPTLQAPKNLSEPEQKLYDLVVRRFLAVFFPAAEYLVTTRVTEVAGHHFKTEGKVLVNPGWLVVYGRESQSKDDKESGNLVPVAKAEKVKTDKVEPVSLTTKPPARYNEATLLSAMEGAGKLVDDDALREAMAGKGLGTPATRAAIIEGLLTEKYLLREGRELIPTAKAFQLMTLLRGLGVEELTQAELTGEWEHKLAQIERGRLARDEFMREIAQMTQQIVKRAKEYDSDTIPGDYATLSTPCPQCGHVVKENYRRFACSHCDFSISKIPGGRQFEPGRSRGAADQQDHRSVAGLPQQDGPAVRGHPQAGAGRRPLEDGVRLRPERWRRRRRAGRFQRPGKRRTLPQVQRQCLRARPEVCVRERGRPAQDVRLHHRQDHPAAGDQPRAVAQAARRGQDRPADRLQVGAHGPGLQGVPGQAAGRQDRLRVRAARRGQGRRQEDHDCSQENRGSQGTGQDCRQEDHGSGQEDPARKKAATEADEESTSET